MKTITIRKVFIAGLLFFSLGAQSVFAQSEKCTSLTSAAFTVSDSTVKFESATLVAARDRAGTLRCARDDLAGEFHLRQVTFGWHVTMTGKRGTTVCIEAMSSAACCALHI